MFKVTGPERTLVSDHDGRNAQLASPADTRGAWFLPREGDMPPGDTWVLSFAAMIRTA